MESLCDSIDSVALLIHPSTSTSVVPVSAGSQDIKTLFAGAVDGDAFKASIAAALHNLGSANGSDAAKSIDSSNIKILGITPGVPPFFHPFLLFFLFLSPRSVPYKSKAFLFYFFGSYFFSRRLSLEIQPKFAAKNAVRVVCLPKMPDVYIYTLRHIRRHIYGGLRNPIVDVCSV